jgi:hypothetical protein
VIVATGGGNSVLAAKAAITTIPIVPAQSCWDYTFWTCFLYFLNPLLCLMRRSDMSTIARKNIINRQQNKAPKRRDEWSS